MNESKIYLRWLVASDIDAVVNHPGNNFWTRELILAYLTHANRIGFVACYGSAPEVILAVVLYSLHKRKYLIDGLLGWDNAVIQLLDALKAKLSLDRRYAIDVEMCEQSLETRGLFLKSQGFIANALTRNGCDVHGDDTVNMRYSLKDQMQGSCEVSEAVR